MNEKNRRDTCTLQNKGISAYLILEVNASDIPEELFTIFYDAERKMKEFLAQKHEENS